MKKKTIALFLALALVVGCAIGGTVAWLTATTETVTNTFTTSDIKVELKETTGTEYKMIPGYTIAKDPKATVLAGSEECWLFVKIEEQNNTFDTSKKYVTYEIADGWTAGKGENTTDDPTGDGIPTNVYYRKVETANIGTAYSVLKGDKVTVSSDVTKTQMSALDGVDVNGKTDTDAAMAEVDARPTLKFTAYASQLYKSAGVEFTAAEAWAVLNPTT